MRLIHECRICKKDFELDSVPTENSICNNCYKPENLTNKELLQAWQNVSFVIGICHSVSDCRWQIALEDEMYNRNIISNEEFNILYNNINIKQKEYSLSELIEYLKDEPKAETEENKIFLIKEKSDIENFIKNNSISETELKRIIDKFN